MKNIFNSIQVKNPSTNVFDLSHDVKLSTKMGLLTPVMAMDVLPGDKVTLGCEALVRLAPLVSPVMHRMDVFMHYFFVPNRILWDNWEKFITSANDNSAPAHPYIVLDDTQTAPGTLANYMGVPQLPSVGTVVNPFPFAAYNAIYHEWFRDQNLIPPYDYKLVDGDNTYADKMVLRRRAWEHDYFTAALPWAQKGQAVTMPTTFTDAPVEVNMPSYAGGLVSIPTTGAVADVTVENSLNPSYQEDKLMVNLENVQNDTTINDLRRSIRLQEFLEKLARGGTRYVEYLKSVWNTKASDSRLQRPEYITGTKTPIKISEVLNTTGTEEAPQGDMAGHGISVTSGKYGKYRAEEHGWIIGIMSVLPKTAYQQGLARMFTRRDQFDYPIPDFANIGEQEVLQKEIYAETAQPNAVFGYVPRYAEMKYMPSRVAGQFQTTLNHWHLGRIFGNEPALNQNFIECNPRKDIFAVTDPNEDELWCHVYNNIKAVRKLPKFGTPTI